MDHKRLAVVGFDSFIYRKVLEFIVLYPWCDDHVLSHSVGESGGSGRGTPVGAGNRGVPTGDAEAQRRPFAGGSR